MFWELLVQELSFAQSTFTNCHFGDSWVYSCYFCPFDWLCEALLLFKICDQTLFNFALSSHGHIRPEKQTPEYKTTVFPGWGVTADFSFICVCVCAYAFSAMSVGYTCDWENGNKYSWNDGHLVNSLSAERQLVFKQKLKDLRGINWHFCRWWGWLRGLGEEGHVGKLCFLCSCELDLVGGW